MSERIPVDAAQGVQAWYRQINGRWYKFALVIEGWWGVGPTGTLTVYRQYRPAGDWFCFRETRLFISER